MWKIQKKQYIKMVISLMLVQAILMSGGTLWAKDNKKSVTLTIESKENGVIFSGIKQYFLAEGTEIFDINENVIPLFKVPIPVEAEITYVKGSDGKRKVLKIVVQKEIVKPPTPE